jgi:diguanylate cyclase (GGDEF)-like protein
LVGAAKWGLGRGGRPHALDRRLAGYLFVQVVLVAVAVAAPPTAAGVGALGVIAVGSASLTVGVWRFRRHGLGWWLVVSSAWVLTAVAIAVVRTYGLGRQPTVSTVMPIVGSALAFLLLAAGIAILGQTDRPGRYADLLDATMTALAVFLVLWAAVVGPRGGTSNPGTATAAIFLVASLLVIALGVRLLLGRGVSHAPTTLILLASGALVGVNASAVAPVLGEPQLKSGPVSTTLFLCCGVAIGAAGMTLSPDKPRLNRPLRGTSPGRIALFIGLALVTPVAWAIEVSGGAPERGRIAAWVPTVVSAAFLLLLVLRLTLIARYADRRSVELAQRTTALADAVSEQTKLQHQLTFRAWHDPLTGLFNRDVLTERLADAMTGGRGRSHGAALLLLDLDGFKDVNDTLGHPVGDDLLVEVSRRLIEVIPAGATLSRLGGDEFAVLLPEARAETALARADELLAVFVRPFTVAGRQLFLTTSIGALVADPSGPAVTPTDALRDADLALYAAKEGGKNRTALFQPELRDARRDHAAITADLRTALERDEFEVYYQPVIDLDSGAVVTVEALARWRRAGSTALVGPDVFVPVAEDAGLIGAIGAWVLRRACMDALRWYAERHVAVSVNVSGRQFEDHDFADMVMDALVASRLPGRALILEITESSLIDTSRGEDYHQQLRRLREHGIRVAIDDFGTGYSSLSYVAKLPVDIVKVDKSFTQEPAGGDRAGWAFINAILRLVESLDLVAIVEGVETAEQAEALRALRCPLVQGFYFARPVTADQISERLAHGPVLTRR